MSLFYRIAYRLGFTPWEAAATHGPAVQTLTELLDRETSEHPAGERRALDLGCGTGHWSRELARRGWEVIGVDLVPRAIATARQRTPAELPARFVEGDLTRLRESGITGPFSFFWDFGALHGLDDEGWRAVGREVTAVASPRATLMTMAWSPGNRGPLPRGAGREQIEAALPEWRIVDDGPFDVSGLPRPLRNVRPRWYRLARAPAAPEQVSTPN